MDTTAYLTRHGWRGDGHSLHPSGYGIKKPLLVSQKSNAFGIGKKKHDAHADQWWARAFDATLKDLNVSRDGTSGKAETVTFGVGAKQLDMVGRMGGKWAANGGLYGAFVRGQGLEGTITPESAEENETHERDNVGEQGKLCKGDREERKRRRKEKTSKGFELNALEVVPDMTFTETVVDNEARKEHQQKQAKDLDDFGKTADKEARKLLKEARRRSQKDRHTKVAGHWKQTVGRANAIETVPVTKKQRSNKATDAG